MKSSTNHPVRVLATGIVVLIFLSIILFWLRFLCSASLSERMPDEIKSAVIAPSGFLPDDFEKDPNLQRTSQASAQIRSEPLAHLGITEYLTSILPGGRRSRALLLYSDEEWGYFDDKSGQLGYYRKRSAQRIVEHDSTMRIGRLGIWTTIITLVALLFSGSALPEEVQTPVVYLMGVVMLMVGVRQSYAKTTAEAELIKQYEFMYRIFRNARRRIDGADNDSDKRRILKVLGDSALEEHAQWILIHRERSIDEKEGIKLGG